MAEQLAEIDAIANDPAPPTLREHDRRAGARRPHARPRRQRSTASAARRMSDARVPGGRARDGAEARGVPDQIIQNEKLFERIEAVYDAREKSSLTPEQQRLAWLDYTNFVRAGREARRGGEEAARRDQPAPRHALHARSARTCSPTRTTTCSCSTSEADLAGLPDVGARRRGRGRRVARARRASGRSRTRARAMEPFLTYSTRRDLREKVWRTLRTAAATTATRTTTTQIITEILKLRAERAKLLGYATHAHWRLEDTMAKTPERAMELMEAVWKPAVARVHEEVADMQAIADKEGAGDQDRALGLPLLRREGAQGEVRPRPERGQALPPARQAARGRCSGWRASSSASSSRRSPDVPVYQPDVRVWEVKDADGQARRPLVLRPLRARRASARARG